MSYHSIPYRLPQKLLFTHLQKQNKTLPVISTARILKSNHKAINYNKQIGYKLLPNQELIENQLYELTFEEYQKHASVLNNAAAQLNKDNSVLKYEGKVSDKNIDQLNLLLSKANH